MTLPASGPITMSQVAVELGLAANYPLDLGNSWCRYLGVMPQSGAMNMSSLLGKTGRFDGNCATVSGDTINPGGGMFGGNFNYFLSLNGQNTLLFSNAPNWPNNIRVRNNTIGQSVVLSPVPGAPLQWSFNDGVTTIVRPGATADSFTITVA
jgi:hypothetical protein